MISIIVPVYNVEDSVERCLESIAAQTYPDFEAILIDDGSTDSSGQICEVFASTDTRFHVIHQKNAGPGFARNTGLDNASGEYVLFVDGDDTILPETLETALRLITSGPYDWAGFGYKRIELGGVVSHSTEKIASVPFQIEELTPAIISEKMIRSCGLIPRDYTLAIVVWNKLFSRRIISDLRFQFGSMAEDVCFMLRIYQKTHKAIVCSADLYCYYFRPSSITGRGNDQTRYADFAHRLSFLRNTPPDADSGFRLVVLRKLYRKMASDRAFLLGSDYYSPFMKACKSLRKETLWEYLLEKRLPLSEKVVCLVLWLFPHICRHLFKFFGN